MTKEVRVIAWCENHPDEAATSEVTAAVGRHKARLVDVCDVCLIEIVSPFLDLMDKGVTTDKVPQATQKPPSPSRAADDEDPVPCPLCETTLATRQGLSGHLRRVHGTGIRALQAQGIDA